MTIDAELIADQSQEVILSELGQAALSYAMNAGWAVFPLHWITDDGMCSCGNADCRSQGKHPLTANGLTDATTNMDQIEKWWTAAPEANIGVRTGAASGFDVVDVDTYKPDGTSVETLCDGHQLPATPISETGRGGLHYLFKYDGHKGVTPDGVDWKSDGGYIVVPPSRGALQPYQWKVSPDDMALAPLPEWLRRPEKSTPANGSKPNWEHECDDVRKALTYIDPGSPRDDWLRIGMAVHHASGGSDEGFTLWHNWSAGELHDSQPENYNGLEDIQKQWDSFGKNSGVTLGTLYKMATDNGFEYAPEIILNNNKSEAVDLPDLPTASEFLRRTYPEPEFLIGPIQNHNIVLIHGPTGIGKTQLCAAIAGALGRGIDWLHWKVKKPRRVLIIDGEMPPGELQRRLELHGVDAENIFILNAVEMSGQLGDGNHLNLADPHWQDVVWGYLNRYQIDVVLVDNVVATVSVPNTSLSSDEFWKPIYSLALQWRGAGVTSIWMDHSNAAGKVFGTKTKTFNCNLVLALSLPDDHDPEEGCRFIVKYEKHRGLIGEMVRSFMAWMDTPEAKLSDMNPKIKWDFSWITDTRQEEVWALSLSHVPVPKIIAKTKVPKTTVHRWIATGKRLGKC